MCGTLGDRGTRSGESAPNRTHALTLAIIFRLRERYQEHIVELHTREYE